MESFWAINVGNALTILVLGAGGIGFVYTMRGRIDALSERVLNVEMQLVKMVEILVQQGRHSERLTAIDQRIQSQGQRLDALTNRFNRYINHINDEDKD